MRFLQFFPLFPAIFLVFSCSGKKSKTATYEFTAVKRGAIERTVSSSGTINPVATVKVLPQMSGKVEKVFADYNDIVKKGDILAELNTDVLRIKRDQQRASAGKARANYELQLINYRNQQLLAEKELISEYELKTSKNNLDGLAADLAVAEANLKEIETEINQYAYIKSPIDGIVLDRNVNVGDTVVDSSSNNSSSIYVIAENLREMQIEASVGELDVASIQKGQQVRFTLESLPGRSFSGEVETLRMVPTMSSNVVSYKVIIKVGNLDGSLLPGMTCAVDFIVERAEDVLMISNAALRYQPTNLSEEQIAEMIFNSSLANMDEEQRKAAQEAREQAQAQNASADESISLTSLMMGGNQGPRMLGGGGGRQRTGSRQGGNQGQGQGQNRSRSETVVMRNLWFMGEDGKLDVMQVRAGISNGSFTEIRTREDVEEKQFILREKI